MKTRTAILVLILFASTASLKAQMNPPQDLSRYDALKEPRITSMPDQKMLVVESNGDPKTSAGQAFGLLFRVFFSIPGVRMAPPRARWLGDLKTPKHQWVGLYALPLPDQVATLSAGAAGAKIDVWSYGEVAEILHVGSYADETPTIQKLLAFIAAQGYVVAGPHEEEYLRGPESGPNTAEYRTIIRYQVKKK
jgi:hypothetical protein